MVQGLGIRGTARVFEVAPKTVLQGLVEAAELLRVFSPHVLQDVRGRQGQRDTVLALLSAVKGGEGSGAEAIARLARSPQGVWVAMDPESTRRLARDVGDRPRAMAPRVVHYVGGCQVKCVTFFTPVPAHQTASHTDGARLATPESVGSTFWRPVAGP